ncbi:MAG: Nucleoside diphosphate kinase [Chlamydiia bacterium]|nr:Nucleoside diphosphate kinase [Chlamydiia bacterium]MCH9616679.1 Nucleoside diphosphate kinase [Chlamydiia bacterium]
MEQTFAMIKPDAVKKKHIGDIISRIEKANLSVVGMKMLHLTTEQASEFYAVHKERPFFNDLVEFVTSGNVVTMVLEGEGAIKKWRDLMGDTDPKKATPGTIRADFATSIDANASHGSDAPETAAVEIAFFKGL